MSKSLLNPFSHQEKKTDTIHVDSSWNVPFGMGGGSWSSFPGSSANPNVSVSSGHVSQPPAALTSSGSQFGQMMQSPTVNMSSASASSLSTTQATISSPYPQPVIFMSPTWNLPSQPVVNPAPNQFSFVNETEHLLVTITNHTRNSIITHLVGKGTKFSFSSSDQHELTISVVAGNDTSGTVAQVDNDPFNLRSKR